ncbi:MAG: leucine--tRNA ligase [Acidobacteria bacterium]|nr:leucine--tRNA ligase [Acidobacteriota bacterium]
MTGETASEASARASASGRSAAGERERYDPGAVEPPLSEEWARQNAFAAPEAPKSPRYALDMFPYPSGDLHVGHAEAWAIGDAIARFHWARGHDVLHPIGFDAFGLPAENAAIKRGIHPREWTYSNIATQTATFKRFGVSFDWSRAFNTCDPEYYRWTQWLFLKFLERGLAYRKGAAVNWCPSCRTVLANEQVVGGLCERCDAVVTKRDLVQWFLRITAYADRLLEDMSLLGGWSDRVLAMQRNWIGRSEGAEVAFAVAETGEEVPIFTTRPDTLWGVTFFVLAPEHPMAAGLAERAGLRAEFETFLERVRRRTEIERVATGRRREGMFLGAHARNPVNGEPVPIWVADYVLMEYGTGAIMAVPAHDQRDFEFARQEGIPVRVVIAPGDGTLDGDTMAEAYDGPGVMVGSGEFDGTPAERGKAAVTRWLEEKGIGTGRVSYRLRDWLISRQRYWGCPIPIVHCRDCGEVPVPERELPVLLPEMDDLTPAETGESPLAKVEEWVSAACPRCGAAARRETDTMDTFVDSSWYYFRYCALDPERAVDPEAVRRWMPVAQYTGGIEHAILHLLYSRFFTKVLHDLGLVGFAEPFPNLLNQGMVLNGEKGAMSKSRGNAVDLMPTIERWGADALRITLLFAGPVEDDVDWADCSIAGSNKWLGRVWRLALDNAARAGSAGAPSGASDLRRATHRAVAGVTEDYERFRFNTAIAKLMTLVNESGDLAPRSSGEDVREALDAILRMLAPMAPFACEALWRRLGREPGIHRGGWPQVDPALVRVDTHTMVVQVNGKVRDRIEVPAAVSEERMRELALGSDKVGAHLGGRQIVRTVVVPPRLVNIVVR